MAGIVLSIKGHLNLVLWGDMREMASVIMHAISAITGIKQLFRVPEGGARLSCFAQSYNEMRERRDQSPRFIRALFVAAILLGILFVAARFFKSANAPQNQTGGEVAQADCIVKNEERVVSGESMEGLIGDGDRVTLEIGYYACHDIARGDIVAYNYAQRDAPIIKKVFGVPGDSFEIRKAPDSSYRIVINGEAQKTSDGAEYTLDERSSKMLQLYEKEYRGKIPESAYLILGNVAWGSIDSTRFGLVGKTDIVARVLFGS